MKTKIILSGCFGKMGRVITELAKAREDCEIIAGLDVATGAASFPVFHKPFDIDVDMTDAVIIDYSHPSALPELLSLCKMRGIPMVIATTGYTDLEITSIKDASGQIPVFFTFNMSLGINLLAELARKAARVLSGFDIEIIEKHHNQKKDAPSGTAIMLAEAINSELATPKNYIYDRHSTRRAREKSEMGIHTLRGGTIVGEHEIIFAGHDEVITLSHSAGSKEVFAAGSLSAAVFIAGAEKGLYDMNSLVSVN